MDERRTVTMSDRSTGKEGSQLVGSYSMEDEIICTR